MPNGQGWTQPPPPPGTATSGYINDPDAFPEGPPPYIDIPVSIPGTGSPFSDTAPNATDSQNSGTSNNATASPNTDPSPPNTDPSPPNTDPSPPNTGSYGNSGPKFAPSPQDYGSFFLGNAGNAANPQYIGDGIKEIYLRDFYGVEHNWFNYSKNSNIDKIIEEFLKLHQYYEWLDKSRETTKLLSKEFTVGLAKKPYLIIRYERVGRTILSASYQLTWVKNY